jgi:diguanylate cyclase (GGDEF)-like protein
MYPLATVVPAQEQMIMPPYLNLLPEKRVYQVFIVSITLVVALCVCGIFLGLGIRSWNLINSGMISIAKAHLDEIIATRKWNADYGGVYVEKKAWVESNPYLKNPDIQTVDGKVLTKRNPAVMTRELSKYLESGKEFSFHITSLRPINPDNVPDPFEEYALHLFEEGKEEVYQLESRTFRYMVPLRVESACLECHAEQGYRLNEIRGGLSVSFDVGDIQISIRNNFIVIIVSAVLTTIILLGFIFVLIFKLKNGLSAIRSEIETMAITDGLTGIFNRRHLMTRFEEEFNRARRDSRNLGCIMLDIDHFKSINDAYGHPAGDTVLQRLSTIVRDSIRSYDVFGRYGGEEFLVILPECNGEDVRLLAERLREAVKRRLTAGPVSPGPQQVTISLGATCIREADQSIDDLLKRADEALYGAKNGGRDRTEWIE